jgi:hypothetical protein
LLTRIIAGWRAGQTYQLRDVDGIPVTIDQARTIIAERYAMPKDLRARRRTTDTARTDRRSKGVAKRPINRPVHTQRYDHHSGLTSVRNSTGSSSPTGSGRAWRVMFDRICRKNGIRHRLTEPASPNQNGKVERFQGTLRPDFFDVTGPFPASRQRSRRSTPGWLTTTMSGRTRRWTRSGPSPRRSGSRPSRPSSVSCCRCGSRPPWHRRTLSIMPTSSIMTRLPIMVGLSIMIVRLVLRSRRGRPRSSARWLNGRVVRSSSTWWCRRRGT